MTVLTGADGYRRVTASDPLAWRGPQGAAYATRNPADPVALDESYLRRFGVTRSDLARRFLRFVPRGASVLEVGCSNGVQLAILRGLGFYGPMVGCDLAPANMVGCREPCLVADGTALPFPARSFDLVLTSGTLMHIPFRERAAFCGEVLRVTRRWVWGMEPWSTLDKPLRLEFHGVIPDGWAINEPSSYTQLERLELLDQEWWPDTPFTHSMWILQRT